MSDYESYYDIPAEHADVYPDDFRDISNAIDKGYRIRAELDQEVPGLLREYITYIKHEAAEAMGELTRCNPHMVNEIHDLQKIISAYTHVMRWVDGVLSGAESATQEMQHITQVQGRHDLNEGV